MARNALDILGEKIRGNLVALEIPGRDEYIRQLCALGKLEIAGLVSVMDPGESAA